MKPSDQSDRIKALEDENQRLKAEIEKSKLSEKRFLDALKLSPMALCHHDRDLRYTWLYNGHMGFVQDDVIGLTDWDILDQDLADRMGVVKRRVLETGKPERVEMPTVSGDENSEYFDLAVAPLIEEDSGNIIGLSCSGIDVTLDRRRREAYKASEENLRFIFNASPMGIVVSRLSDGLPLFYNRAADTLLKLKDCRDLFAWLDLAKGGDVLFSGQDTVCNKDITFVGEGGDERELTMSSTKIFYDGETAILSVFHDLTKEARNRKKLEEAKEKAELASIAKSQFLASASHDLRQPLHAMGLLISVLEHHVTSEDGRKILSRIMGSLEAMNELFAGILDISKLDADVVSVQMETVDVAACFSALEREFREVAKRQNIRLDFIKTSACVYSDHLQFERILRNIISNALRYTEKGRVLVGARRKGNALRICVYDTGIGIDEKDQEIIFQEFRQVGNPERDRRKGLGLGLAICERIAQLLETRICLRSRIGHGSAFWFDLPLVAQEICEEETKNAEGTEILKGKNILFIEDEIDVQVAMRYMLEAWGCIALVASSVEEALSHCGNENVLLDAILADYRLRDNETGLDVIVAVCKKLGRNIPAIILSGDTGADLIRDLESYGLPLLNKPLLPKELQNALIGMLR